MTKGFTLLELLIVLALIGIASAMILPKLYNNQSLILKAETRQIIAILKHARHLAMLRRQEIDVPLILQKNIENPAHKIQTLIFFPTGGAQGQDLFHCRAPISVHIKLDTITGKVSPEFDYDNPHCQRPKLNPKFEPYSYININKTKQQYQKKNYHSKEIKENKQGI